MINFEEVQLAKKCYRGEGMEEDIVQYFAFLADRLKNTYFRDVDDVNSIYVDELEDMVNAEYWTDEKNIVISRARIAEYKKGKLPFTDIVHSFCHEYWHHIQQYTDLESEDINQDLKETLLKSKRDSNNEMRFMDDKLTMMIMNDIVDTHDVGLIRRYRSLDIDGKKKLAEDIRHSNYLHLSYEEDARENAFFLHYAILDDYKKLTNDSFFSDEWYGKQMAVVNKIKTFDKYNQHKYYSMYSEFYKAISNLSVEMLVKLANKTEHSVRKALDLRDDPSWEGLEDEKEELMDNLKKYSSILKKIIDGSVEKIVEDKSKDESLFLLNYALDKKQKLLINCILENVKKSQKYTGLAKGEFYNCVYEGVMNNNVELHDIEGSKNIFTHEQGVSIVSKLLKEQRFSLIGEFCKNQVNVDKSKIVDDIYKNVVSFVKDKLESCETYQDFKDNSLFVERAVRSYEVVYKETCKDMNEYNDFKENSIEYGVLKKLQVEFKKRRIENLQKYIEELMEEKNYEGVRECLLGETSINIKSAASYFLGLVSEKGRKILASGDCSLNAVNDFDKVCAEVDNYIGRISLTSNVKRSIEGLDSYKEFQDIKNKVYDMRKEMKGR